MTTEQPEVPTVPAPGRRRVWSRGSWLVLVLGLVLRLAALVPLRVQLPVTRRLGRLLGRTRRKTRLIAERNLALCFPDLSEDARRDLLERHLESLGASLSETAIAWFGSTAKLRKLISVEGREHLERARQEGRGVILFSAHFTTLELGLAMLEDLCPGCCGMYHPPANATLDALMRRGRSRFVDEQIPRDDVRRLVRRLKEGAVVVYVPDQTHAGSQCGLLPFFGEMAITNTATSKLAKLSGAVVIPYFFRRLPDATYVVDIGPPVPDFPSLDPLADTLRLVELLENYIRQAPEQYLWTYKKFRGRPAEYPDVYAELHSGG